MAPFIVAGIIILVILGIIVFPIVNRKQFSKLPFAQKVRILMKEAKGLAYFKNVSEGKTGTLIYVKNKRKIYFYPWILKDGAMYCTREDLFINWDYPEEAPEFTEEERIQALSELENFNKKNAVKIYLNYDA